MTTQKRKSDHRLASCHEFYTFFISLWNLLNGKWNGFIYQPFMSKTKHCFFRSTKYKKLKSTYLTRVAPNNNSSISTLIIHVFLSSACLHALIIVAVCIQKLGINPWKLTKERSNVSLFVIICVWNHVLLPNFHFIFYSYFTKFYPSV